MTPEEFIAKHPRTPRQLAKAREATFNVVPIHRGVRIEPVIPSRRPTCGGPRRFQGYWKPRVGNSRPVLLCERGCSTDGGRIETP